MDASQKQEIEREHPCYTKRAPQWKRCRDVIEGADEVKAAGVAYLPKLPGQSDADYAAYKLRAVFYEATGRTLEGLTGLVMGKSPRVDHPAGAAAFVEDCDLRGRPLSALCEDTLEEVLTVGRYGLLVDHPPMPGEGVTLDQVEALGLRPYIVRVEAESVINWEYARIANRWKLSRIVIREAAGEESKEKQYRELKLVNGSNEDGTARTEYHIVTWTKGEKEEKYTPSEPVVPLMQGRPLPEIPFFFAGVEFGDEDPDRPPLKGLVELNLHHYTTSADKRHALFHCGLPTPIFAGFTFKEGETVNLGGPSGIVSPNENAKATYLEFTGQGIQPLKEEEESLEAKMAKLGARMLAEDKKQAEAAETLKIRASGESSTLASVAQSISKTMTQALQFACAWGGWTGEALVVLNTDFGAKGLTAQELTALTGAVQSGKIPVREYVGTLLEHGAIITDRTGMPLDEIVAEVEANDGAAGFSFQPGDPNAGGAA